MELAWIMAIAELCNKAVTAGKTVMAVSDSLLGHLEKELLISAHHDGLFHLVQSDIYGKFVTTNKQDFTAEDPCITAHYLDAFTKLCDRGLIDHQSDDLFRLTGQGFDIARKLAK